jgi:hypothetical protein
MAILQGGFTNTTRKEGVLSTNCRSFVVIDGLVVSYLLTPPFTIVKGSPSIV